MQKRFTILAAAVLAVGGFGLVNTQFAFADDNAAQKAGDAVRNATDTVRDAAADAKVAAEAHGPSAALPAGIEQTNKDDSNAIRSALAGTVDAAINKDLHAVVGYFVDADRDRTAKPAKAESKDATLAGRMTQFQNDWKQKYGQKFEVNYKVAFGPQVNGLTIAQGEITNPTLLSNWPVENKAGAAPDTTTPDARRDPNVKPRESKLQKGRKVAIVTFPAEFGLSETNVSLIHEITGWRIDVPDNIDAQRLHDNLLNHLTMADQAKDQWPADVNDAYRLVAHHVFMGIYDVNPTDRDIPAATPTLTPAK